MDINKKKYKLVEKIASAIGYETNEQDNDFAIEALKVASEMLKASAEKQKELELKVEKLSLEVSALSLEKLNHEKREKAEKLAFELRSKGLIKKSEIDNKISELEKMDSESFEMFKCAVENIPEKNDDGYTSELTFCYDTSNIKERDSLKTALNNFVQEVR